LVPCEGFRANVLVMWLPFMGPMNKGSIVEAVLQ